jgi:hypothetical protein
MTGHFQDLISRALARLPAAMPKGKTGSMRREGRTEYKEKQIKKVNYTKLKQEVQTNA